MKMDISRDVDASIGGHDARLGHSGGQIAGCKRGFIGLGTQFRDIGPVRGGVDQSELDVGVGCGEGLDRGTELEAGTNDVLGSFGETGLDMGLIVGFTRRLQQDGVGLCRATCRSVLNLLPSGRLKLRSSTPSRR